MTGETTSFDIIVRVAHLPRLFHSLDPSPFRERDLDAEADEFIVGWARDAPRGTPFRIIVEVPQEDIDEKTQPIVAEAVRNHFNYKAWREARTLKELLREGRRSLLVGFPILAASLLASRVIATGVLPYTPQYLVSESLLILGWVANWRPLEIFLYDWLPNARRRKLYRQLAAARVEVRAS
jgi:hypothetical protein